MRAIVLNYDDFELNDIKKIIDSMLNISILSYRYFQMRKNFILLMTDHTYNEIYQLSPYFFPFIEKSLTESSLVNLFLLYDEQKNSFGLKNILLSILHLVKNRKIKVNDLNETELTEDLSKLKNLNDLIKLLNDIRDKRYAHASKESILDGKFDYYTSKSIKFKDIQLLINFSLKILNKYNQRIFRAYKCPDSIGHDDYKNLLEILKSGLATQKIFEDEFNKKINELKAENC